MAAELVGIEWDEEACLMEMWDGQEVGIGPGDTVAGYMTPDGTLIAVTVFKRPPDTDRPH
jgi:hypothetical protein